MCTDRLKNGTGKYSETDLKINIRIAEMSLDQVVKILDKQLANYYLLFTKVLRSRLHSCCTSPLVGDNYD